MNLVRRVWLPPDGDNRLVRFQEELARTVGRAWTAVPPHVVLESGERAPEGWVAPGSWSWDGGQLVLEAWDAGGRVGAFWFGPPGLPGDEPPRMDLPPPPPWRWTRGRLGFLDVTMPSDDPDFVLWTWRSLRCWKSALPSE